MKTVALLDKCPKCGGNNTCTMYVSTRETIECKHPENPEWVGLRKDLTAQSRIVCKGKPRQTG